MTRDYTLTIDENDMILLDELVTREKVRVEGESFDVKDPREAYRLRLSTLGYYIRMRYAEEKKRHEINDQMGRLPDGD